MPAGHNPHKSSPAASGEHRLRMAELGVAGLAAVVVSDFEAKRSGPSFTVETLESLAERYPGEVLRLLIGADNLEEFLLWRQPERLLQLADLLVFPRGEAPVELAPELRGRATIVAGFACSAASTGVRAALAAGRRPAGLLPPTVLAYIARHGLYGCAPAGGSGEGARCP
jgi:nicotinate-nucleotide adenylyltransferase